MLTVVDVSVLFSEPKIPHTRRAVAQRNAARFQCSSASRKFLTGDHAAQYQTASYVSVLFSEPKIPHFARARAGRCAGVVSVLFSEPKIPHPRRPRRCRRPRRFQCSSASRKFLTWSPYDYNNQQITFQCSSASRKFLTLTDLPPIMG